MDKKYTLVTGASKGIGKAIALTLAKEGYSVLVNYLHDQQEAEDVAKEIKNFGGDAYVFKADVSIEREVKQMLENITKLTSVLDLVVNNAGFDYGKMIEDYTIEEMRKVVEINLLGTMIVTKYSLPLLKQSKNASIINIASRMGKEKTIETVGAYAPAKAGIIKFTQCCALEFAKYKIRVNCVNPGFTDTGMTRSIVIDQSDWDNAAKSNPRGRVGQPQDIANVVSFLASDKSDYINGESIGVNGGSILG